MQPTERPVNYDAEHRPRVIETLARLSGARPDQLGASDRLADLGVDSLTRVELVTALEARRDERLEDATAAELSCVQDLFELV